MLSPAVAGLGSKNDCMVQWYKNTILSGTFASMDWVFQLMLAKLGHLN